MLTRGQGLKVQRDMGWFRNWTHGTAICTTLAVAFTPLALGATNKELKRIETEKRSTAKELSRSRQRLDEVQSALRSVELDIAGLSQSARENTRQLNDLTGALQDLEQAVSRQEKQISQSRQLVAEGVRNLQTLEYERAALKALLNGANIASVSRYTSYQRYVTRAHEEHVAALNDASLALEQSRTALVAKQQELAETAERLGQARTRLQERATEQKRLVVLTNQEIGSKQGRLRELEANEKRLKETLRRLALQRSAPRPHTERKGSTRGGLSARKGQLDPPVAGTRRNRSGRGVLIEAPEGEDVRAIAGGKVAFAEWLRGYGLLLIIDHGSGFMSLYGHNQNLLKTEGDTVATGDTVASVGNTGGQSNPGVYFELRHDGQHLDPIKWLRDSATR